MSFWEMVQADAAKLVGTGGELTETVQLAAPHLPEPVSLPAVVARGQEGTGAINDRNRSLFDPEINAITAGRLVVTVFNDDELIAAANSTDLRLGWALKLPESPNDDWDFARIESRGGGLTTVLWARREAIERGPHLSKRARGL